MISHTPYTILLDTSKAYIIYTNTFKSYIPALWTIVPGTILPVHRYYSQRMLYTVEPGTSSQCSKSSVDRLTSTESLVLVYANKQDDTLKHVSRFDFETCMKFRLGIKFIYCIYQAYMWRTTRPRAARMDRIEIESHSQLPTRTKNQKMDFTRSAAQDDKEETHKSFPIGNLPPKAAKNVSQITESNPSFR